MELVFLDRKTIGNDIDLSEFNQFGNVTIYETTNKEETLKRVKNADIVITNKVVIDKEIIKNSNIKLICIAATGMNNVDLESARMEGIEVKNVSGYSTHSVAQTTFALALELIGKTNYYSNYVKEGSWEKSEIFTHIDKPFFELKDKNWGIIGLGNIGEQVAKIANSFGCNVSYHSTSGKNNNTKYKQKSLESLLRESDIISIHCPFNDTTNNMINKTNLNLIKDGSILLNLGRGGIINEKDLVDILANKTLYCGLDVVETEPLQTTSPLKEIINKHNLIITPHIGWSSIEARNKLKDGIIENISKYIS